MQCLPSPFRQKVVRAQLQRIYINTYNKQRDRLEIIDNKIIKYFFDTCFEYLFK